MPLILSPMPGRVKRHDSPTPVGISVLGAAVWECGRTFTRPGALPKEWAMGEENPLLNFRVPQSIKDTFSLHAKKAGAEVGPMLRQWCVERIAVERVLELLKSVDLPEVLRRLSAPSAVMSNHIAITVHMMRVDRRDLDCLKAV